MKAVSVKTLAPEANRAALTRNIALNTLKAIQHGVDEALGRMTVVNPIMASYLRQIGATMDDFKSLVVDLGRSFEQSLLSDRLGRRGGIPPVSHRIWLTNPSSALVPPAEFVKDLGKHYDEVFFDHVNYFWVNAPEVAAHLRDHFAGAATPVTIVDISTFRTDPLFSSIEKLIAEGKFVLASDLLRICVLRTHGGIYSDLGARISREVACLASISDYVAILGETSFFQTSVFGAPADSDLINLIHGYLATPTAIPHAWVQKASEIKAATEVAALAGPGVTALIHLFAQPTWRFLVLSNDKKYLHWRASRSWYGNETKFGNADIARPSRRC